MEIKLQKSAKEFLGKEGFSEELGARPLGLLIQKEIKNRLSDLMLFGELKNGGVISFFYKNGLGYEILDSNANKKLESKRVKK